MKALIFSGKPKGGVHVLRLLEHCPRRSRNPQENFCSPHRCSGVDDFKRSFVAHYFAKEKQQQMAETIVNALATMNLHGNRENSGQ
jgi:hypothetical protein